MRELKECVLAEYIDEYEDFTERSERIFEKGNVPHGWTVIAQLTDNKGKRDPEYQEPAGYAMVGENTILYSADAHDALAATNYPCVPIVLWRKAEPVAASSPDAPAAYRRVVAGASEYYTPSEIIDCDDNHTPLYRVTDENSHLLEGKATVLVVVDRDGSVRFMETIEDVVSLSEGPGDFGDIDDMYLLYAKKPEPIAWVVTLDKKRILRASVYAGIGTGTGTVKDNAIPLFEALPGGEKANPHLSYNPGGFRVEYTGKINRSMKLDKFFVAYADAHMFACQASRWCVPRTRALYPKKSQLS